MAFTKAFDSTSNPIVMRTAGYKILLQNKVQACINKKVKYVHQFYNML